MNRPRRCSSSWGHCVAGTQVYAPTFTARNGLGMISVAGVPADAPTRYQQPGCLTSLQPAGTAGILCGKAEHQAWRLVGLGCHWDRALSGRPFWIALIQTPHRFPHQTTTWTYSGLGLEQHDMHNTRGRRTTTTPKKPGTAFVAVNHDPTTTSDKQQKDIFQGCQPTRVKQQQRAFHDFYEQLLAQGRKPPMARLTLARKIAASR